jgi:hypothetical protein
LQGTKRKAVTSAQSPTPTRSEAIIMTNQTSRVLLALVVFLSIGCQKVAIDVGGDNADRGGQDGGSGTASPIIQSTFTILESPQRDLDILFVIDNSPSMDPKQAALAKNFPKMMEALQKMEGGLPDIHIGVISSDVGAGSGEAGGNCSVLLGNRGILWGNDPNVDPGYANNQYASIANVVASNGYKGCGLNANARWIEDIQNPSGGVGRTKNYLGNLNDAFSCLAQSVGTMGCGYEHTLQSLRVALNPAENINPQNFKFLRPKANLAIVIVSDEDDCSADPNSDTNDGMFLPRTLGDTASLRCAARGHVCNGKAIPNYDPASGYTGSAPFVANFADCDAKDADHGFVDGKPLNPQGYRDLPLIRIQDLIESVKQVKERPDEQIWVAGIIGWPENANLSGVQYRIDKDSTSMPVEQQKLWDYMPLCTIPSEKSADGNIYKAYGAFRIKKFIDGFGDHGRIYSICNPESIADALQAIGETLVAKNRPLCVLYPLVDTAPAIPEVQPECVVLDRISCDGPGTGNCLASGYEEIRLPECIDPNTGIALSPSNPDRSQIPDASRPCWYLSYDKDPDTGCPETLYGQKFGVLRKGDGSPPPGTLLHMTCLTCATPDEPRCTLNSGVSR